MNRSATISTPERAETIVLPEPRTIADTGLNIGFLADLALKHIYSAGLISGYALADALRLPFYGIVEDILAFLRQDELIEVTGAQHGYSERSFEYTITTRGRARAHEALHRSQYAGAAPVPLNSYIRTVQAQALGEIIIDQAAIARAFADLVVSDDLLHRIGPAANSARSLFLYGPSGNGKTTIAERIAGIVDGHIWVPVAIEIDGQIVKVFDPLCHQPIDHAATHQRVYGGLDDLQTRHDQRWVLCRRPSVVVGGELVLSQLELIYDPIAKVYEAPYQMKANGGLFLIDDFGRQQCRPQDLLNRWIVPLEKKVDYLALQTGKKLEIPFDVLIVFSTNLDPSQLVDDAFLRRIRHKIEVPDPTPAEYREIFQRVCAARQIPYSDDGLRYLLQQHYAPANRPLRCCHPRDLCDHLLDEARYRGVAPEMTPALLERACHTYFITL